MVSNREKLPGWVKDINHDPPVGLAAQGMEWELPLEWY